jgi:hypothetical protein
MNATAGTALSSSHNNARSTSDHSPPLSVFAPSSSTTTASSSARYPSSKSSASASDSHRPKTAPSSQAKTRSSSGTNASAFEQPIPKIAIFADALSLKKLREQYQTIRKSPTLPDLSHTYTSTHESTNKRPTSRRVQSATAPANHSSTHNVTADLAAGTSQPQQLQTQTPPQQTTALSPQLPELNFDCQASSTSSFSRRAPASRSSNGVDTGKGPPPAIVTRSSSYTAPSDLARRANNPAAATLAQQRDKSYNGLRSPTSDAFRHSSNPFDSGFLPFSPTAASGNFEQSLDAIMDRESTYSDAQEYLDERASKYNSGLSPNMGVSSADTEGSGRSTEDLFLNLAQDSPAPMRTSGDLERRLVSVQSACSRICGGSG